MNHYLLKTLIFFLFLLTCAPAHAWHDHTHVMVAKVAGMASWYNAAGPDLAKIKSGNIESYNHWFNNDAEVEVTVKMVFNQISRYNQRKISDAEGHVYGAILASLRAYEKTARAGKYAEYHLAYCAHYITDLSQPLHNIPHDDFNKAFHHAADGIVESTIWDESHKIMEHMYTIKLDRNHFEADLAREIARIANISRKLGYKMRARKRNITRQEAYIQLGHSASLLKAVLEHYQKP